MIKERIMAYASFYTRRYGVAVCMMVSTILISMSLYSFSAQDLSLFYHATNGQCHNMLGYFGATLAAFLVYFFGIIAYAIPVACVFSLFFFFHILHVQKESDRIIGVLLALPLLSTLATYHHIGFNSFSGPGGFIGLHMIKLLVSFDHMLQGIILYTLLFAVSILILRFVHLQLAAYLGMCMYRVMYYMVQVNNPPARFVRFVSLCIAAFCVALFRFIRFAYRTISGKVVQELDCSIMQFERDNQSFDLQVQELLDDMIEEQHSSTQSHQHAFVQLGMPVDQSQLNQASISIPDSSKFSETTDESIGAYALPDIEKMLDQGGYASTHEIDRIYLSEQAAILEEKLKLFGVAGKVVRIHPGPVITLFEYRPQEHIKLSKIIGLEDDLAMALQALSIRLIAPIPGKDVVGFEVANKIRTPVLLSNIFHSVAWTKFKGQLPLILGEDTYGNHIVVDLATMPHLLIAGSTGSGKSVALNCMLVSLLCQKKPEDLKLIIIDPKQIEFTAFEHIAHLLFPIVTDSKKAIPVLKWLVMTMEQRYELMAQVGVKNIFEYQKIQNTGYNLEPMPFIVLIIDELADLMMTTGKDAENLIARLAQMARAAGIHLIIATQRPSVDVITGLIKVNFPNRISFKVTSKIDSRTILDEIGAERLLGKGDMLFLDAKDPYIRRIHGAYVSEQEISYLVEHIRAQQEPHYLDLQDFFSADQDNVDELGKEDQALYQQVIDLLEQTDEISISMIQRRFRIGYNRSARIVDTLKSQGLIMTGSGGKMKRVLKD